MTDDEPLAVGVIGVGSMGAHHARVYAGLPAVDLVGVADTDWERAKEVAAKHGTRPLNRATLLQGVDAVSVVVPTQYHAPIVREALEADTHVLVEKPFVDDPATGRELIALADRNDLRLQVGHIERFNPAVRALTDVLPEMDVLAVDARRLGPPVDRENTDGVVEDLMIHDLDVLLSLFDAEVDEAFAAGIEGEPHVAATLQLDNGVLGTLTASRITHQKIRTLAVTGRECRVSVDYLTQSVKIHRHSLPGYVESNGDVRYRSESVVERPQVNNGEPLRAELESFVSAVNAGSVPEVTGHDGLRAIELVRWIREEVGGPEATVARTGGR
ncbi:gfo/Idh/MocA family oxidoreductase [Halorubrum sp. CBA1125]|uniref:Gfo/Idh/MocA family protein n=1 Tax=Halorubrum sp. CBA1125 TaxID=2668072 RepID=UPI0012E7EC01|nr:Gfo/Idh/MocA family oxidoreductase [Halorubrum sp. CBA1125]MUW14925.1 gfo/Idh/MocA family oxidoreductase [Halorubrum sp. CBA1125]